MAHKTRIFGKVSGLCDRCLENKALDYHPGRKQMLCVSCISDVNDVPISIAKTKRENEYLEFFNNIKDKAE